MLNFAPTEEQEEIRKLARSLAEEQLRPHGREAERSASAPESVLRTLAQTGLTTPFPEALGSSGPLEAVTYALIAEELSFGDGALAMHVLGSLLGPVAVALTARPSSSRPPIRRQSAAAAANWVITESRATAWRSKSTCITAITRPLVLRS